jgi:hypothetical protein
MLLCGLSTKDRACVFMAILPFALNWRKQSAVRRIQGPDALGAFPMRLRPRFQELGPIPQFKATAKLSGFLEQRLSLIKIPSVLSS